MRSGHKQTDVGVIPEAWDVRHLSQVAEIRGGIAKSSNALTSDPIAVHYLRVANVHDGYLDLSDMSVIQLNRRDLTRYTVMPGDVLMATGSGRVTSCISSVSSTGFLCITSRSSTLGWFPWLVLKPSGMSETVVRF